MSQAEKAAYYAELKDAGVKFTQHYREYSTEDLAKAVSALRARPDYQPPEPPAPPQGKSPVQLLNEAFAATIGQPPKPERTEPEYAAERAYQEHDGEKPIRTDEQGRVWYREEVLKPAFPKPRARRVIRYVDSGVNTETVLNGKYIESFEVAGSEKRTREAKITMPSYQVGVFKDPKFPFKIHTYNGLRGFDLFDVHAFYGGADLVPAEVKRVYVENDLCFDIRTTIRAIQTEHRQNQLKGTNA